MESFFITAITQALRAAPKASLYTAERAQVLDITATLSAGKELLHTYKPQETLPITLNEHIHTLYCIEEEYASKAVALYAHWSPTGNVDARVCYALEHLAELGYTIIFISGNANIQYSESLKKHCAAILTRSCTGYDFTSWKAAFERFPSLYAAKECLLTNDSILFPIGSALPIHSAMNSVSCDFWGLVASAERCHHVQSYYLVLRESTLQHPAFATFIRSITTNAEKMHSVFAYEITFTTWLASHGLVPATYIPLPAMPKTNVNPAHYFWKWLIEDAHVPILKRDMLRKNPHDPYLDNWQNIIQAQGYPLQHIEALLRP